MLARMAPLRARWRVKEPFSCYSHLLGVALAIPGLVFLILQSDGEPWRTVGFAIYGTSLVVLYGASTLYHWLPLSPRKGDLLRRFDHIAIYLLIAGSYTPVCFVTLRGAWGWSLFAIVWGCALIGAVVKLLYRHHHRWVTTGLYIGLGWMAVVAIVPLVRALPIWGLTWLLAGGVCYSIGAIIYGTERPDPYPAVFGFHEIFHIFVLAGSVFHFVFMARYILPSA
jgi:hemolysin III